MKTKEKIIRESWALFNKHGERNVTTNHIAEHMGISPGNLYYHFRNKEEVILAIFEYQKSDLEQKFIDVKGDDPVEILGHYLHSMFENLWRFRFLYASVSDILERDKTLHQEYLSLSTRLHEVSIRNIIRLKELGLLDIDSEGAEHLVQAIHINLTFWVSYLKTLSIDGELTQDGMRKGVVYILTLIRAYASDEAKLQFDQLSQQFKPKKQPI